MLARRVILYRLYLVLNIAIIWVLFSLLFLYNIVEVEKGVLETRRLSFFSLAFATVGIIVASAEAFFLKNIFRKLPIWLSTILRMTLTFILIVIVSILVLLAYWLFRYPGELNFIEFEKEFVQKVILTPSFLMLMVDLGFLAFFSILVLEISDKYGPGGLRNLIRGKYNKPRKENRIFLFLDMNDSTVIAEHIGHEKYFNMLKEFFSDITEPILNNGGNIYQYVGDEIVLSWKNDLKGKRHCLKFVKDAYNAFKKKAPQYMKEFGFAPSFKAGIHAGDVTAGYIGIIKKDLVYSGDTLNTAARIRSKCHQLGHLFVASGDFLGEYKSLPEAEFKEIGEIELKGKQEKVKLYGILFPELLADMQAQEKSVTAN
jgi:adenylate cyclase